MKVGRIEQLTHTPGPWRAIKEKADVFGLVIPFPDGYPPSGLKEADARLMAAAPDLLAALKTIIEIICDKPLCGHFTAEEIRGAAQAAIAKAEGSA